MIKINGKVAAGPVTQSVNVKGEPYLIVDGKHVEAWPDIKADQIESVSVYKDAKHTTDKYGEAAKNGVVEVTLKKK